MLFLCAILISNGFHPERMASFTPLHPVLLSHIDFENHSNIRTIAAPYWINVCFS
jgi:hypothetical protein